MKAIYLFLIACTLMIWSCSEDDNNNNKKAKVVCINWGASVEEVEVYMNSNNEWSGNTSSSTPQVYHYTKEFLNSNGWKNYCVVSYEFTAGALTSSSSILQYTGDSLDKIAKLYLPGYTYLGESNSTQVYVDESKNTIAVIYKIAKEENEYYAIGWTILSEP